jgi:quinol monooxygenase YgiN
VITIIGLLNTGNEYNMILATLRLTVQAERRDEFLRYLHRTTEEGRKEPGCISCRFYEDMEHENTFALLEKWKTQEDLDKHIRMEIFRMLIGVMDILSGPPEILFEEISHTSGIEVISAAFEKGHDDMKRPEFC